MADKSFQVASFSAMQMFIGGAQKHGPWSTRSEWWQEPRVSSGHGNFQLTCKAEVLASACVGDLTALLRVSVSPSPTTGPTTSFFTPRSQGAFQVDSSPVGKQKSCYVSERLCLLPSSINYKHLHILIWAEKWTHIFWEDWTPMDLQSFSEKKAIPV